MARRGLLKLVSGLKVPPEVRIEPVQLADGLAAEWLVPPKESLHGKGKVFLYLHGGGYAIGSPRTCRAITAKLALMSGMRILSLDYRLAPENPYPAALEDTLWAYRYLQTEKGYGAEDIVLAGDSAGGGLALAAALRLRDEEQALPCCMVLMSPWADLTGESHSAKKNVAIDPILDGTRLKEWAGWYVGMGRVEDVYVSPVFGDYRGMPPLFVSVGTEEVLLDDSLKVAEQAHKAQVPYKLKVGRGQVHVYPLLWQFIPEARTAMEDMVQFVWTHCAVNG